MISKSHKLLTWTLCLCTAFMYSQEFSISGKVIDTNTIAVSYANIVLLNPSDSSFVKGTSTDDNGFFKINTVAKGNYILKASFIGYKDVFRNLEIHEDLSLNHIILIEDSENLEEVNIVVKRPTITRKPDRLTFNVENTALIEGSTLQVLKSTPGVIVTEGSINIKSAPATVFINNRRVQLTSDELIQLLDSSPANSIKSVEVITNPPANYDADSGSVINIIMSKNLVTGYRGNIFTNYTQGVFPRYNGGTSHYFKNDKVSLNLNYSYTNQKINRDQDDVVKYLDDTNSVDQIWGSDVNRNTWSETHNLNLNFDYYLNERNTLSMTSTGLYMPYFKYQIRNQTAITDENLVFLRRFTADNLSRDNKYNIGSDVIFRHELEDNSSIAVNVHFTKYNYERDQNVFSNFFDNNNIFTENSEFNTIANQDTEIFAAKFDYNLPIHESTVLDLGAKFSEVNTDSDITKLDLVNGIELLDEDNSNMFDYDENVYAAYANFSTSWNKWDLNLGMRVEKTEITGRSITLNQTNFQDYFNWFPNTSILYQISNDITVYGSYKRSITRPNYTNLNPFTFFLNENTVVVGNPNLTPTYRDHYKIGTSFLEHFTIEAYYMNYDGAINELPRQNNETNIISFTPVNLDKTVDYGFDFIVDLYPTDKWNIYAVTSFFNITEEADFGNGFVELSQWSNYSILSNTISFLKDNSLNMNLTLYWVGKNLQALQTVEDRIVSEFIVTKSLFNNKAVVSLSIEDIFNYQDYETSVDYLNQLSSSFVDIDNRFIKLGFRYKFGNTKLETNERTTDAEERERLKDLN